jgi:carboxypeptidase C (cathepsin A)
MSVRWNRASNGPAAPLLDVLGKNPNLVVLHASGIYDLVTPAGPPAYEVSQLDPALRTRVTLRQYDGGHSFYLDRASRMRFMEDGTALIRAALARVRSGSTGGG